MPPEVALAAANSINPVPRSRLIPPPCARLGGPPPLEDCPPLLRRLRMAGRGMGSAERLLASPFPPPQTSERRRAGTPSRTGARAPRSGAFGRVVLQRHGRYAAIHGPPPPADAVRRSPAHRGAPLRRLPGPRQGGSRCTAARSVLGCLRPPDPGTTRAAKPPHPNTSRHVKVTSSRYSAVHRASIFSGFQPHRHVPA